MFVDSDDYLQEDMVKLMMHEVVEANADLVLCNVKAMKDEEGKDHDIWFSGAMRNTVESIYDNKDLINTILPAPWGKVYRKALFTENSITFSQGLRNQDLGTTRESYATVKESPKSTMSYTIIGARKFRREDLRLQNPGRG